MPPERPVERAIEASLWMALAQLGFAAMNVAARLGAADLPWAEVGAARFLFGGVLAAAVARARGVPLRPPADRRTMWARSALGTLAALCTFYAFGVPGLAVGDAVTIMSTSPVFVALLAGPVLGERAGAGLWAAAAVSMVGVVLVAHPTFHVAWDGGLAALGSASFGAAAMMSLRRLGREPSEAIVVHFAAVATVVLLAVALPELRVPTGRGAIALVATGAFGGMAQLAMTRAYALAPAARVAALGYLSLVFTRVIAAPVFGERPDLQQVLGSALVLAAGLSAAWGALRAARRASRRPG